jgi:hypothetical protein
MDYGVLSSPVLEPNGRGESKRVVAPEHVVQHR